MVLSQSVAVPNKRRTPNESIPSVSHLRKQDQCQTRKRKSAVQRKRAAANVGPKPTNVATFAKRKKAADGGMIKQAQQNYRGSYISGDLGGVEVSNPSLKKYYKGML